jgi:hypothetical protein
MKIRVLLLLNLVLILLPSCGPAAPDYGCTAVVQELASLRQDLVAPAHLLVDDPLKNGSEFDPNTYFDVFAHLSMQEGYFLDFVYTTNDLGGFPTLFAVPEQQDRLASWSDVTPGMDNYLYHVQVDDTPEGFLQFAILAASGEQFYLDWHANYNDLQVICTGKALKALVKTIQAGDFGQTLSTEDAGKVLEIQAVEPVITLGERTAEIQVLTFTKWGGFNRVTYIVDRAFPHLIVDVRQETLVPYNCGIVF